VFKFVLLVNYLFPESGSVGLQFRSHPKEIMTEVLKTFRDLDIGWKKTGAYNVKCRWLAPTSSSGDAAPTPGGITDPPIAGSMYRPSSSDCWTADMHGDPNAQTKDSNVAPGAFHLLRCSLVESDLQGGSTLVKGRSFLFSLLYHQDWFLLIPLHSACHRNLERSNLMWGRER